MTRRGFIGAILAAFAALRVGRTAYDPLTLADIAPQTFHVTELDRILAEEAERLGRMIVERVTQQSPWLRFLEPAPFPHNAGQTVRVQILTRDPLPGNGA